MRLFKSLMYNDNEDSRWEIGDKDWRQSASTKPDIVIGELVVSEYDIMLAVEKLNKYNDRAPSEEEIELYILTLYGP